MEGTSMIDLVNRVYLLAALRLRRDEGQTFVEYALIGVLVAVVVAGFMAAFTDAISGALTAIEGAL
jgi:Flp pilus assembly pilin Flp